MTTTNFPDGFTNAGLNGVLANMIDADPSLLHAYWSDFDQYIAADFVVTAVGAGTAALTAGNGGLLLVTNAAADDNSVVLQKTPAAFTFAANKRAWFTTKFQTSDATQSDIMMGLVIVNTTPIATPPTDGIYFLKSDGVATVDIICRKNATTGSNSKTAIATLANATDITLQWFYDGNGRVFYGVNGVQIGSLDASASFLPDATNLTVTMVCQNGEAVAKTMTVDYIYAAIER